jgi:hypothetical protein
MSKNLDYFLEVCVFFDVELASRTITQNNRSMELAVMINPMRKGGGDFVLLAANCLAVLV